MTLKITKLLVANRGEIAVRIIKAAQELDIPTVAICSEADVDSMPARLADEVRVIGPARADKSYLVPELIIQAALESGANAIHPGYGFLSENAAFAEMVVKAGLIFVGPDAGLIRKMGDKAEARRTAQMAGVPVVPGSDTELKELSDALESSKTVGFPLLIKASAGGGGRGIRMARNADELAREFPVARREAQSAFGSGHLYLERFIESARHIEVQVIGDGERAIHLFERECSLQRRRQKVFEEAPSPALSHTQRELICASAVALTEKIKYKGAGTLEYLYDAMSGEFFFIEMNTRVQVEHPVSEMVTGVDIVNLMLRIAGGESLNLKQSEIKLTGAAIEMRINAEDATRNFFPSPGLVEKLVWPKGVGVRVETHIFEGYKVPLYYDSLLAKLVVHGKNRAQALERAVSAVEGTVIKGMPTTLELHSLLLNNHGVQVGNYDTSSLEHWLENGMLALSAAEV